MELVYKLVSNNREPRPRSKRLRELGGGVVTVASGGAAAGDGHSHANKELLDSLAFDDDGNLSTTGVDSEGDTIYTPYLKKAIFDDLFEKVVISEGRYAIRAKYDLYSDGDITALGRLALSAPGGSGTGVAGMYYGDWTDYSEDYDSYAVSGKSGKALYDLIKNAGGGGVDASQLGSLTISRNGVTAGVYSPSKASVIDITVPTRLSELIDDKGYLGRADADSLYLKASDLIRSYPYTQGTIANVRADGVMEVGKYIDFHDGSGDTSDYNPRLMAQGGALYINSSRILTEGNYASSLDGRYLRLSGGTMTNTNLVTNLNADLLDGKHATDFVAKGTFEFVDGITVADWAKNCYYPTLYSTIGWAWVSQRSMKLGAYEINNQKYSAFVFRQGNINTTWSQSAVMFLPTYWDASMIYIAQLQTEATAGDVKTAVKRYADYDTVLASNVASATRLRDTFSLWGQSFYGNNVSGDMSGVGSITGTGPITLTSSNANHIIALHTTLAAGGYSQFAVGKSNTRYNRANLTYWHVGDGSTSNYIGLGLFGADKILNILASGKVGVNTTNPAYPFDVNGSARVTSLLISSGLVEWDASRNAFKFNGNLYATGDITALGSSAVGGSGSGGGAETLAQLADVTLSGLSAGHALVYDGTKWTNRSIAAAGLDLSGLAQYLSTNQYLTQPAADGRYVTLATEQTVTGKKTFSSNIMLNGTTSSYASYPEIMWHIPNVNYAKFKMDSNGAMHLLSGGDINWTSYKSLKASSFVRYGGTSSQILMADGSVKALTDITSAYVTALGTNGNYLTWTKNGVTNNITVPYATNADTVDGLHAMGKGSPSGLTRSWARGTHTSLDEYYGNGNVVVFDPAPTSATSAGQNISHSANTILLSLGESSLRYTQLVFYYDTDTIRYRRRHDTNWRNWVTLLHTGNYSSVLDGRYVKKSGDTMSGILYAPRIDVGNMYWEAGSGIMPTIAGNNTLTCGKADGRWANVYATTINVTSTSLVANLNADLLDGYHSSHLYRIYEQNAKHDQTSCSTLNAIAGNADSWLQHFSLSLINNNNALNFYVGGLTNERTAMIQSGHNNNSYANALGVLHLNPLGGAVYINKVLAATINSNVASATKWQTARRFWGQLADGTADVNGAMTVNYAGTETGISIYRQEGASGAFMRYYNNNQTTNYFRAGMYGAGYFGISYNSGADAFAVTASGSVGIGTTTPAYKLDVAGDVRSSHKFISQSYDYIGLGVYRTNPAGGAAIALYPMNQPVHHWEIVADNDNQSRRLSFLYTDANGNSSYPAYLGTDGCLNVKSISIGGILLSHDTVNGGLKITGNAYATGDLTALGVMGGAQSITMLGVNTTNPAYNLDVNGTGRFASLLNLSSGATHKGAKIGDAYINAISKNLLFQNVDQIRFGGDAWDYAQWAGIKYDHSAKTVYLGIADGSVFEANSKPQTGGKLSLVNCDLVVPQGYKIQLGPITIIYNATTNSIDIQGNVRYTGTLSKA
ncbi:MAG: hypothetical protein K2J65_11075 [Duncaniella sp.]|nr:hypothetical protein [Duncaniella sp.]